MTNKAALTMLIGGLEHFPLDLNRNGIPESADV